MTEEQILELMKEAINKGIEESELKSFMATYYSMCGVSVVMNMIAIGKENGWIR